MIGVTQMCFDALHSTILSLFAWPQVTFVDPCLPQNQPLARASTQQTLARLLHHI
jgi:hypothetical protein